MSWFDSIVEAFTAPIGLASDVASGKNIGESVVNQASMPSNLWEGLVPEGARKSAIGDSVSHGLSGPRRYAKDPSGAMNADFQHPMKTYDELSGSAGQRRSQAEESARQAAAQNALLAEARQRQVDEGILGISTASQAEARRRQRSKAALAQGRRSTILTGPLGIPGSGFGMSGSNFGGKTLLGG
jgi:hypothetical protein